MRIERYDDVGSFFEHVGSFLAAREAENNLLLGFRTRLVADPRAFGPVDPYLAAVLDGGEVAGVAVQTPPFPLVLSTMSGDAAAAVADARRADPPAGLNAPVEVGEAFIRRDGRSAEVTLAERVYEAAEVIPPRPTPGRMRRATTDDRELLVRWLEDFLVEALPDAPEQDAGAQVDGRLADPHGALWLWEDDAPVSFAGHGSPTPTGMRIGPVYTPPELRGRGYASALTASVTAHVLGSGRRFCFLYTNLANPTSNSIYQRIGYRPVLDVNVWRFA
ncbi:MAG TPA: GNAT family N-acetyltransferase [Gaiellaceae bacterium]